MAKKGILNTGKETRVQKGRWNAIKKQISTASLFFPGQESKGVIEKSDFSPLIPRERQQE